jgi:hypothetical protein
MISISYTGPKIKIDTKKVSSLFSTPLKLSIKTHIGKREVWTCEMEDYHWAVYENDSIFDIDIKDSIGKQVLYREWNVLEDGSDLAKALYLYCSKNNNTRGIAIGTHDGEFGEWVPAVKDYKTDVILIEASTPQFNKLSSHYLGYPNVTLINNLVTTNGQEVEFFEGGAGYTNSVKENVIRSWEKEEIHSAKRSSISINSILENSKPIHWLHLDIEGYDAELIKGIYPHLLPPFIIFEHNNLSELDKSDIISYLESKEYSIFKEDNVSYLAIKNNV